MTERSADEWRALSEYLDTAFDLDAAARGAWLEVLRQQNPAMAEQVAAALAVREQAGFSKFLAGGLALPLENDGADTLVGRKVGPYVIDGQIGRGGMGSVWRARRADGRFEGIVAIKFIHAAWIGRAGEQRFQVEGNLLGRLDHPHIARLLDAGVLEGTQPYLILEYVEGQPIDTYCNSHKFGVAARIRVFRDVLAAVAHAHSHLVVHRDLKPSNIFVTREGTVKLLDFGIAKLLDDDAGSSAATRSSASALTPQYAAPEQLLGKPVSTAADVYALGLVLYELLTGSHPHAAGSRSSAELINAVITEVPCQASKAANVPTVSRRMLEGDLDNILHKALKKEPAERYASVGTFSDDLQRFLTHQPVQARPDTVAYRAQKFVRRNRGSVLSAVLVALALLLTTGFSLWQVRQTEQALAMALAAASRADAVGDFLVKLLNDFGPSPTPQAQQKQLDRAHALLSEHKFDDPLAKANLLRYFAGRYAEQGDMENAVAMLEEALSAIKSVDDPIAKAQLGCSIADAYDGMGRNDESDHRIRESMALLAKLGNAVRPQVRADCRVVESYVATARGENRRAIAAAELAVSEVGQAGIRIGLQHETVVNALARANAHGGHNRTAVALLRGLRQASPGASKLHSVGDWIHAFNEAGGLLAGGRVIEAEALSTRILDSSRALGIDNFRDAALLHARILIALGRLSEAEPLLTQSLDGADPNSEDALQAGLVLVEFNLSQADLAAAHRNFGSRRIAIDAAAGRSKKFATAALRVQASIALRFGDTSGADALLRRAAELARDADHQKTPEYRKLAMLQSESALLSGMPGQSCRYVADALAQARLEAVDSDSSAWVGEALLRQSRCESLLGQNTAAQSNAHAALAHLEANLGATHPLTIEARGRSIVVPAKTNNVNGCMSATTNDHHCTTTILLGLVVAEK